MNAVELDIDVELLLQVLGKPEILHFRAVEPCDGHEVVGTSTLLLPSFAICGEDDHKEQERCDHETTKSFFHQYPLQRNYCRLPI